MDYTKIQELIRDWDIGIAAVFALLTNYLGIWEFSKHSKEWKAKAEETLELLRRAIDVLEQMSYPRRRR